MPINHPAVATAGVIAISVAVAAAIAVYESPELRRMAEELRRKVALAFHSFGDIIEPHQREPLFNRPEDADGFLRSRGTADPGVVADDETLQRQRQELMYWNAIHLEKEARELMEKQKAEEEKQGKEQFNEKSPQTPRKMGLSRTATFDDFMRPDQTADRGTFVFNTGASVYNNDGGLVQRRPFDSTRGMQSSVLTNPFGDEHQISDSIIAPGRDELPEAIYRAPAEPLRGEYTGSDLYDDIPTPKRRPSVPEAETSLPTFNEHHPSAPSSPVSPAVTPVDISSKSPRSLPSDIAAQEAIPKVVGPYQDTATENEAFTSIQAWAHNQSSNPSFYSPIPVSPAGPLSEASEPDIISRGELTPTDTDSFSIAGSGVDIAQEVSSRAGDNFDVMSESEGMMTPASWTEVGSVVSEDDQHVHA